MIWVEVGYINPKKSLFGCIVRGNTYPIRYKLKEIGFKWNGEVWVYTHASLMQVYKKVAELEMLSNVKGVKGDKEALWLFAKKHGLPVKKVSGCIAKLSVPEFVKKFILEGW